MTRPVTGYASTWLEASGLVGRKQSLEKGDAWGSDNTTCADGQLAGDVQAFNRPIEQLMSAATRQDLSVLGSCEKSRDHLRQDSLIKHRGSFSHGPKSPTSQSPKGSISQGSPSTKAPLDKNEKDNSEKKNPTNAIQVGMLKFGAKRLSANEASKEENNRAPKRLYEPVNLGLAGAVFGTV
nr:hypothetical protein CFP56_45633 [Quercus suber]